MTLPRRSYLPAAVDYNESHSNSLFKHRFRNKADAESYFNDTFGAGTLTFLGTEGTDYEFDSDNGFRVMQDGGYARILLNNIVDADLLPYLYQAGFTFELTGVTSEWVGHHDAVLGTYVNPIPDVPASGGTNPYAGKWWVFFYNNNTNGGPQLLAQSDATVNHIRSSNQLQLRPFNNAVNQAQISTILSTYNKGDHVKFRVSLNGTSGQLWADNVQTTPAQGAGHDLSWGPNGAWDNQSGFVNQLHTSGDCFISLGAQRTGNNSCGLWMRDLRFFDVPTSTIIHPYLQRVFAFGDSYSASSSFLGITGAGTDTNYNNNNPPSYNGVDVSDFADISGATAFTKTVVEAGYGVHGLYGGGQGAKDFTASLLNDGGLNYLDMLVRSNPTMVFTFGMHNDATPVRLGTITIDNLKTKLMDDYIKPVMDTGCNGWGFIIPGVSQDQIAFNRQAVIDIAEMLISLPAAWDAAYPQYAGKVKVKDARGRFGQIDNNYHSSIHWQEYFYTAAVENVHPSPYGHYVAGELAGEMAKEWITS